MKKISMIILIALLLHSCDTLNGILSTAGQVESAIKPLTQQEVGTGLKEALSVGINNAVGIVSKVNGFYSNSEIKIPFPQEAIKIKEICETAGLKSQVTQFEETLNRAAEEASKGAKEIFIEAITQMTIPDAISILKGNDDAATQYLKKTTTDKLYSKFYPVVKQATEKVMLTKYWTPLTSKYNAVANFAGGQQVNTDLNAYVTNKALDGLFKMVSKEEKEIRVNPTARVNSILQRVFGSDLNPRNNSNTPVNSK